MRDPSKLSSVRHFALLCLGLIPIPSASGMMEMDDCIQILPECVRQLWQSNNHGDATNEEELSFGLLGTWMKGLYTKKDPPYLADDANLRASTLVRLKELASFSLADPSNYKHAIGVGQMLFLYFWWGVYPPEGTRLLGPSIEIVSLSAHLHAASLAGTCSSPSTDTSEFEARKCPWRWRFVLLLLVELGKQLAVHQDLEGAAQQFRMAEARLNTMRSFALLRTPSKLADKRRSLQVTSQRGSSAPFAALACLAPNHVASLCRLFRRKCTHFHG